MKINLPVTQREATPKSASAILKFDFDSLARLWKESPEDFDRMREALIAEAISSFTDPEKGREFQRLYESGNRISIGNCAASVADRISFLVSSISEQASNHPAVMETTNGNSVGSHRYIMDR